MFVLVATLPFLSFFPPFLVPYRRSPLSLFRARRTICRCSVYIYILYIFIIHNTKIISFCFIRLYSTLFKFVYNVSFVHTTRSACGCYDVELLKLVYAMHTHLYIYYIRIENRIERKRARETRRTPAIKHIKCI